MTTSEVQPSQDGRMSSNHPLLTFAVLFGGCTLGAWIMARELDEMVRALSAGDPHEVTNVAMTTEKLVFLATVPAAIGAVLSLGNSPGILPHIGRLLMTVGVLLTTFSAGIAWLLLTL